MTFKFTELQEKWLQALESGEWKQQRHAALWTDEGYCCLGVACELMGYTKAPKGTFIGQLGDTAGGYLSDEGAKTLGLRDRRGALRDRVDFRDEFFYSLASLNDRAAWTFAEIAAYIRANPTNVFAKGAE